MRRLPAIAAAATFTAAVLASPGFVAGAGDARSPAAVRRGYRPQQPNFHPLDPFTRVFAPGHGCLVTPWGEVENQIEDATFWALVRGFGAPDGAYTGSYPDARQAAENLVSHGEHTRAEALTAGATIGGRTVRLAPEDLEAAGLFGPLCAFTDGESLVATLDIGDCTGPWPVAVFALDPEMLIARYEASPR